MASPLITDANLMKVSSTSPPQMVANAIFKSIFDHQVTPIIRAIGAGATSQTCKAIAIARGMVAVRGVDLSCVIGFDTVEGESGKEISAQLFVLKLV